MGTYIVTKDLVNVRNQPKLLDSTLVGSLTKGTVVQLDDETVEGDTPAGTTVSSWHPDTFNRYVSAAAVSPADFATKSTQFAKDVFNTSFLDPANPSDQSKWRLSWGHIDLEIWRIWKEFGTQGQGVKVVVIDDGAWSTSNDLKGRISQNSKSLLNNDTLDSSSPIHGTACAGLIGANGATARLVYGVAPQCELTIVKAGSDQGIDTTGLNNALNYAFNIDADIVSISRGAQSSDPILASTIQACVEDKNMLIFCGAGDLGTDDPVFPASDAGTFSVGAYMLDDKMNRQFNPISNHNSSVVFLAPGKQLLTAGQATRPFLFDDTSAATPFAAGMFALLKSVVKDITPAKLLDALKNPDNISQIPTNTAAFPGCVVPNIYQIISSLKTP